MTATAGALDLTSLARDAVPAPVLARLTGAPDAARWVCAAHEVHEASALLADLRRTSFPESVWQRVSEGREARLRWYQQVAEQLRAAGFDTPVVTELRAAADALATSASGVEQP